MGVTVPAIQLGVSIRATRKRQCEVAPSLQYLPGTSSCVRERPRSPLDPHVHDRGGISVAMALSMPRFEARDYLLAATYAVVVFSILV